MRNRSNGRFAAALALSWLAAARSVSASPELWVPEPERVAYAVGNMTFNANDLGLSDAFFEHALEEHLADAGLSAYRAEKLADDHVLFLDLVVEETTFVASIEFWRKAEFALPNGTMHSDYVIVWEDFCVGEHENDPDTISRSVARVLDSFVEDYRQTNQQQLAFEFRPSAAIVSAQ